MILQRLLPGARSGGTDGATMMATMITAMMLAAMLTVMVMKCSYAAGGSRRAPHAPRHERVTCTARDWTGLLELQYLNVGDSLIVARLRRL